MNLDQVRKTSLGWKLFAAGLIVVIIILATCKEDNGPTPPVIKTVKEQIKIVERDEAAIKRVRDSSALVIKKLDLDLKISDGRLLAFIRDYGKAETEIDTELTREVPDTCRELQIRLTDKFNSLKASSANKDAEFNKKISTLTKVRSTLENQLREDSVFQAKQRASIDTCLSNQTKLEAYVKQIKPRRSIYVGLTGLGSALKVYEGVGVNLGLENKKGTKYEIGVLQIGGTYHYTVGVKKTLFKF